ncbi:MAG: tRNA-dihydrouridine synthase, partial [Proteobacteria bacterium]|nr:tRNA-dihydrouridine synthase [Pseudomonadota bacterium]
NAERFALCRSHSTAEDTQRCDECDHDDDGNRPGERPIHRRSRKRTSDGRPPGRRWIAHVRREAKAGIDRVAEAGCRMFVVHARNAWLQGLSPKENREVPPLRYDWAYRLKRERPDLQVVVNGGIASQDEATAHLAHADGAMLGRAAYHDPYLLHRLDVAWFGGELKSRAELLRALRPYVDAQLAGGPLGKGVFLKHITRHVLGLFGGQRGGRAFRQVLSEGAHKPGADWSLIERALAVTESFNDRSSTGSRADAA